MRTTLDIFTATKQLFNTVPHVSRPNVCRHCLGAVSGTYEQCASCWNLFHNSQCTPDLDDHVVPMSIALNPSPWYAALLTYKGGEFHEHGPTLGTLAYRWLAAHGDNLSALLDGAADYVTIVPSKKGVAYDTQPLRKALAVVRPMQSQMRQVLRCPNRLSARLRDYRPEIFEVVGQVKRDRIVLVEDTWIGGATALSAAGALMDAGATSVVITPIAREMKPSFHGKDHPYLDYLSGGYDIEFWPR